LYLVGEQLLAKPTLYLSAYFEKHKGLYYDNLMMVRTSNNLSQWVKFFLAAIIETCEDGVKTFEQIFRLRDELEGHKILVLGKKVPNAKGLLTTLYANPVVNGAIVSEKLNVSLPTANSLIDDFVRLGILKETTGLRRNRLFVFTDYMNLFKRIK
jgi:Fic family protein